MTHTYSVTACLYETMQVQAVNEADAIDEARSVLRSLYGGLIFDDYEVERIDEDEYEDDDVDWNTPEHE